MGTIQFGAEAQEDQEGSFYDHTITSKRGCTESLLASYCSLILSRTESSVLARTFCTHSCPKGRFYCYTCCSSPKVDLISQSSRRMEGASEPAQPSSNAIIQPLLAILRSKPSPLTFLNKNHRPCEPKHLRDFITKAAPPLVPACDRLIVVGGIVKTKTGGRISLEKVQGESLLCSLSGGPNADKLTSRFALHSLMAQLSRDDATSMIKN